MSKLVFLSSPYTHENSEIKSKRYMDACKVAAKLLLQGIFVLSPIVHGVPLEKTGKVPDTWEFWHNYCRRMIASCDVVYVINMKGWDISTGVKGEIEIAKELNKSVYLINEKGEIIETIFEACGDFLETREFYELMQVYRHTPLSRQLETVTAFEEVKTFVRDYNSGKIPTI